jgi:hypothetical protein
MRLHVILSSSHVHRQRTASGWTKLDYICDQEFSARKQRHYASLTGFVPGLDSFRFSEN